MRAAIRMIDRLERKILGVYEFSNNPACILRIQRKQAGLTVYLGEERILKGSPVLAMHLWNEHMPKLPAEGANMEWALSLNHLVVFSFKELARVIESDQQFSDVKALYGTSALFSRTGHTGGIKMMQHHGFTILPYHNPLGKFSEFWENLFSWGLMWTYNQTSLNSHRFWQLQRTEVWMTAPDFLLRYGGRKGNSPIAVSGRD